MHLPMWINGFPVNLEDRIEVVNPARPSEIVGSIPRGSIAEINLAVQAAKVAQPDWAKKSFHERASVLSNVLDRLETDIDDRITLFVRENGKTVQEARAEIRGVPVRQRLTLALADELDRERLYDAPNGRTWRCDLPYGVVVSIVPWNSPISLGFSQIISALLAGNAVVIKPPETCPLALMRSIALVLDLLPAGILNVVTGLPADIGDALTKHPNVAKIGFTGSIASARHIMVNASETIKGVTFELGGNDAAIVLSDADLSMPIMQRMTSVVFRMSGQVCMAIKRIYVHQSIYDQFLNAFSEAAQQIIVGDGLDLNVSMGPLHSKRALERAKMLLADSANRGAMIREVGVYANGETFDADGYFMLPTLVSQIGDDAPLVREEQFCAVIPILAFETEDEVIARANDTEYGLGGSVWSTNVDRALQVANRLEAATIFVNTHGTESINRKLPYGGLKQSGVGCKSGIEGVLEYLQVRTVTTYED
jgi:acyl-CoA reductase-like NAD-dependent aldehyde dehydrogenase